jgi:DNA-binding LytR/AlgR family response regulator
VVLAVKDILYIASDGHYLDIYTSNKLKAEIDRNTIKEIKTQLPEHLFVQIHRKYLVNMLYIKSFNSQVVKLQNGTELKVSRTYKNNIKELFQNQGAA